MNKAQNIAFWVVELGLYDEIVHREYYLNHTAALVAYRDMKEVYSESPNLYPVSIREEHFADAE